ncbi:Transmembrane protein 74 [Desmophyllum pertusum]|uniref:Transmembrane protein 74 n=1 Tax=Desmophyllum pertusum TaxID=174260 RepID=A0A9W9ZYY3_9CNID|nr:Transmembrane protein 74 [Desmophyllum pertusum]
MASDQQRRYQPTSYQASGTNNAEFYSNHSAGNNAMNATVYPLHAAHYEGAPAPFYYYTDSSHGPRLGLIRGYHRQMYEPIPQQGPCCDCAPARAKGAQLSDGCNWGVAFGCVLLIIGVIAILMGFMVPQKPSKNRNSHLTHEERQELDQINLFIDVFVIAGLSVLSVGGLLISVALLLPLLRRTTEHRCDEPIKYFGSEVYVKSEQLPTTKSGKPSIDLGFHKDVMPGDVALRKIQPESVKSEPVELTTQANSP